MRVSLVSNPMYWNFLMRKMQTMLVYFEKKFKRNSNFVKEYNFIPARPRKRMRKYSAHKSYLAKDRVERGLERVTKRGRIISAKVFKPQIICKCLDNKKQKLSCSLKIDVVRQEEKFKSYQDMKWSQKTFFLRNCVKRTSVKAKKCNFSIDVAQKKFNHVYTLIDANGAKQEVCREFFINCLQVTSNRIFNALKSIQSNAAAVDMRGKGVSGNKTSAVGKCPQIHRRYSKIRVSLWKICEPTQIFASFSK